jgi:hypothetical protein
MKKLTKASVYIIGLLALAVMPLTTSVASEGYDLLKAADPDINKQYVRAAFGQVQNKKFNANDRRRKLLLIGDSQAQDFFNSAMEHDYLAGYQIRTRHIPSQCQPYLGDPSASGVASKDKALCAKVESLAKAKSQIANADVVVLASLWRDWAVRKLPETIGNLALRDNQKLIVVGRKSFGRISLRHYLRMSEGKRTSLRNPIHAKFFQENNLLRSTLSSDTFVDQYSLICGRGQQQCPVFTPEGELISFDGGHLTKAGARFVGDRIFASGALRSLQN